MAINRIYCATSVNGGVTGALDTIDGNDLADKDMAIVMDQTNVYFFVLDDDASGTESTPWTTNRVINPDDNPGTKSWILQSLYVEDVSMVVDDLTVGDDFTLGGDIIWAGNTYTETQMATLTDGSDASSYHLHTLDTISNPAGDKTFNMTTRQLSFLWTNPSGNPMELEASGAYTGALLHIHQHTGNPGSTYLLELEAEDTDVEHIKSTGALTTSHGFCLYVTGDTVERLAIHSNGAFTWGPGNGAVDTNLYRSAANVLTTDDSLNISGALSVGINDAARGIAYLYGSGAGSTSGGTLNIYVAADEDGNGTDYFQFKVDNDDLYIGCSNDDDMLRFIGGATPSIRYSAAVNFNSQAITNVDINSGAIDGTPIGVSSHTTGKFTTCDATTDFTIDGLVISADKITNDATLVIETTGLIDLQSSGAAGTAMTLRVGESDSIVGAIGLFSDDNTAGPYMNWVVPPDNDGSGTTYFSIQVNDNSDDFYIGADNDESMLQFLGGATPSIKISAPWTAAGETCANLGTVTTADINGGTIDGVTIGGAVAPTVTNLGSVTTCDINGGTIDGVTIASSTIGSNTQGDAALTTLDPSPASDETASGKVIPATVDTNTVGYGGCVYLNAADSHWDNADKDAESTAGAVMIGIALGTTGSVNVLLRGFVRQDDWDWTVSAPVFIGDSGALTQDVSGYTTGDIVRIVGHAFSADILYFNPSPDYITIA